MKIYCNETALSVAENSVLQSVLQQAGIEEQRGIAVAVNDEVIPREEWVSHVLNDGDRVLIIKAAQGG